MGVGVKIMVLFLLIGVGMALSAGWVAVAQTVATSPNPAMGALDIVGESLIFLALCWFVPKIVAGVLGGSPAFTGGEIIAVATPIAYGAVMAAQTAVSLASSGIGALAGAGPSCRRRRNGQRRAARSSRTARHEWCERRRRPTCAPGTAHHERRYRPAGAAVEQQRSLMEVSYASATNSENPSQGRHAPRLATVPQ